jgi:hypothetical protein
MPLSTVTAENMSGVVFRVFQDAAQQRRGSADCGPYVVNYFVAFLESVKRGTACQVRALQVLLPVPWQSQYYLPFTTVRDLCSSVAARRP